MQKVVSRLNEVTNAKEIGRLNQKMYVKATVRVEKGLNAKPKSKNLIEKK
jgi:hypothetical protein